jgi:hypothetical protein
MNGCREVYRFLYEVFNARLRAGRVLAAKRRLLVAHGASRRYRQTAPEPRSGN